MKTIRNLALIACIGLLLLSPGATFMVSFFPGHGVPKFRLEGRKRPEIPAITWKAVACGKMQSALDGNFAFSVPRREDALLTHAKWQRMMIRRAARLFGIAVYPTFYASTCCRIERDDALAAMPGKASPSAAWHLMSAAQRYSKPMKTRSNIRWFFALVDRSANSLASPLSGLMAAPTDYDFYRKHLLANLPKSCKVIDLGYAVGDDVFTDYFRTDHHWRIQGAVRAYGRIAEALGIEPVRFGPPKAVTGPIFFGSASRVGLDADVEGDVVYDVDYPRSPLRVSVNGEDKPETFLNYGYKGLPYAKSSRFEDVYKKYFHRDVGVLHIVNARAASRVLLIVGDSFARCMERFFAESYRDVYRLDPRHTTINLSEFLASHHVDDALFLVSPGQAVSAEFLDFL